MPKFNLTINELLDQMGDLPSLPEIFHKAINIIEDPTSNMKDLAGVIKLDQAMSSLILRWANSGYYALNRNIISIEQAITFLGQRTVQNLVLAASISKFMNQPLKGYELDKGELWKRSVGTASGAKLIISDVRPNLAEDAYYAGLFCDVGKLAFQNLLAKVSIDWEIIGNISFDSIEQQLFGFDHAAVGAEIIRRWNLSENLAQTIEYHHTPSRVESNDWKVIAYSVHAADAIMMMFGIGTGLDSMQYPLDQDVLNFFKWDENSLTKIYERLIPMIEEAETFINQS